METVPASADHDVPCRFPIPLIRSMQPSTEPSTHVTGPTSEDRSKILSREVRNNILFKGLSAVITLLQVPLLLSVMDAERYGVWLILLSMIPWLYILDTGIGYGLRNKVIESLARNDSDSARQYISINYMVLGTIVGIALSVFLLGMFFVDYQALYHTRQISNAELRGATMLLLSGAIVALVLNLVNALLSAIQRTSWAMLPPIVINFLFLVTVFVLHVFFQIRLWQAALLYTTFSLLVPMIVSFFFFKARPELIPSRALFDWEKAKESFRFNASFFIINLAWLIISTTDNIIISRLYGPTHVTPYAIAMQFFNQYGFAFYLILAPFWALCTDAYARSDLGWIRRKIRQMLFFLIPFFGALLLGYYFFDAIIARWIGKPLHVAHQLKIMMVIFIMVNQFQSLFIHVLGGTGRLRVSAWVSVISGLSNIPLSILFATKFGMGTSGVMLASTLCVGLIGMTHAVQVYYLIYYAPRRMDWVERLMG